MTICKDFKQTKPRSMRRVLSDIEFLIANDYADIEPILSDIIRWKLLKRQVETAVRNERNKKAFQIINPSL